VQRWEIGTEVVPVGRRARPGGAAWSGSRAGFPLTPAASCRCLRRRSSGAAGPWSEALPGGLLLFEEFPDLAAEIVQLPPHVSPDGPLCRSHVPGVRPPSEGRRRDAHLPRRRSGADEVGPIGHLGMFAQVTSVLVLGTREEIDEFDEIG
jgi:hypothetical protein